MVGREAVGAQLPGRLLEGSSVRQQLLVESNASLELLVVHFETCEESEDLRVETDELVDEVRLFELVFAAGEDGEARELLVARRHPARPLNEMIFDYLFVHF